MTGSLGGDGSLADGMIDSGFLRRFTVAFDFDGHKMYGARDTSRRGGVADTPQQKRRSCQTNGALKEFEDLREARAPFFS